MQNRDAWVTPVGIYAVIAGLIIGLATFTGASMPEGYNSNAGYTEAYELEGFWSYWMRWDTEWYVEVAQEGYDYIPNTSSQVGYFPVYPLLMRWLAPIFGNPIAAGMVISSLSIIGALLLLYRIVLQDTEREAVARRSVLYIMLYPAALFFIAPYTESLFLLLSLAALWAAREKKWLWAAIFGAIASATRVQGFLLIALVGMEWLNAHGWCLKRQSDKSYPTLLSVIREHWQSALLVTLIPSGLVAYMAFQWVQFGTPFAFINSHTTIASDLSNIPFLGVIVGEIQWTLRGDNPDPWIVPLGISALIFALVTLRAMWRKLPESYVVYTAMMILVPMWTGPLYSMTRFVGVMFPVFIVWAIWGAQRKHKYSKYVHLTYITVALLLLCLATLFHIRWLFVA